jgi:hypothetical protein
MDVMRRNNATVSGPGLTAVLLQTETRCLVVTASSGTAGIIRQAPAA